MDKYIDFGAFRSIAEIIQDLRKPIAVKHLERRTQGGKDILYISWTRACDYLDYYAFGWSYEIVSRESIGGKLILTVRLSIPAKEGLFWREATGQEDEKTDSWGDSSSNAEAQALKRAAAKFGLARYLYELTDEQRVMLLRRQQIEIPNPLPVTPLNASQGVDAVKPTHTPILSENAPGTPVKARETPALNETQTRIVNARAEIMDLGYTPFEQGGNSPEKYLEILIDQYRKCVAQKDLDAKSETAPKPPVANATPGASIFDGNPVARSLSDLITAKQLGMIRALCRELGIDPDEEAEAVLNCKTDELSKKAAFRFIEYLQDDGGKSEKIENTVNLSETATRSQIETIQNLAAKIKNFSMIDFVQEVTKERGEVFEDLSQAEADLAIKLLSEKLTAQAQVKTKTK